MREFIGELLGAIPDLRCEVVATTSEGERCAVQWRLTGTFAGPGTFAAWRPPATRSTLEGFDLLTVRDGLIQSNDAFTDTMTFAAPDRHDAAAGLRRRAADDERLQRQDAPDRGLDARRAGLVAEGVWVVQGQPGRCNVFLIEDGGRRDAVRRGRAHDDARGRRARAPSSAASGAWCSATATPIIAAARPRWACPCSATPTRCRTPKAAAAFATGPRASRGCPPQRQMHRLLHRYAWDGGPVKIAGTVNEGDEVAGFRVIDLPGHAPGQIGLWRESDRLALVSDCFYTIDMWGRDCAPHVPEPTYNFDTEQARASIRKLAALEPAAAWPGHAKPVTGDVRAQLERAADAA